MRAREWGAFLAGCALLAACSSTPRAPAASSGASGASGAAATTPTAPPAAAATAVQPPEPSPEAAERATEQVRALAAEYWTHQLDTSPALRLQHGLAVERLPDLSYEGSEREAAYARDLLARLAEVDAAALDHDRWLTRAVLAFELERQIEGLPYFWHFFQTTP